MNILSSLTKKQNDSVYYLKDGKVTTGGNLMGDETEEADYFFKIRKGKLSPWREYCYWIYKFICKKCSYSNWSSFCIFSISTNKRFWFYNSKY